MQIFIYNSLSRKKEIFKPIQEGKVGMYVCGPTVYGPPHLGHAKSYVNFDVVRRFFEYAGYNVKYVQNITDVGHLVGDSDDGQDKILVQAQKENVDPYALSYKYETEYFYFMDKLNIKRPTISARATGFIPDIIEFIQKIIEKGYAYVTKQGNVYFSVHKFSDYGKLSNRKIENNLSGERISIADDKEFPEDFALWKSAVGGHIMKWNSPWGIGYPGWHIECSTLSRKFLGETFDIHGGGIDNIFPHHDSEIAQSEVANGKPFVNYFMHNNLVTVNGTKMGKSLGNFITLNDLFEKFDPLLIRYYILQFHYRKPVDFSFNSISKVKEQYDKLVENFSQVKEKSLNKVIDLKNNKINNDELSEIYNNFISAMSDDFNTPLAMAEVLKLSKIANNALKNNESETLIIINSIIKVVEDVLGLEFVCDKIKTENKTNDAELLNLISDIRTKLRSEKNYQLSDYIRDKLTELGVDVLDKKI